MKTKQLFMLLMLAAIMPMTGFTNKEKHRNTASDENGYYFLYYKNSVYKNGCHISYLYITDVMSGKYASACQVYPKGEQFILAAKEQFDAATGDDYPVTTMGSAVDIECASNMLNGDESKVREKRINLINGVKKNFNSSCSKEGKVFYVQF